MIAESGLMAAVGVAAGLAVIVMVLSVALVKIAKDSRKNDSMVKELLGDAENPVDTPTRCKKSHKISVSPFRNPNVQQEAVQPKQENTSWAENVAENVNAFWRGGPVRVDPEDESVLGRVNFALSYEKETESLSVHIVGAEGLPALDMCGSSDPYVRAWLYPDPNCPVKLTRVHRRTLSPRFNQTILFPEKIQVPPIPVYGLWLKMNYIFKYDLMHGGMSPQCHGAKKRYGGHHHFGYHGHHPKVRSRSLKSESVLSHHHVPTHRLYRRQASFSPHPHTQSSYSMAKLEELNLCMQVMDYDRFSRDDPIGEILLPLKSIKLDNSPMYWKNLGKPVAKHLPGPPVPYLKQKGAKPRRMDPITETEGDTDSIGEILISMCYMPQKGKLTVVIIKAKDLPAKDITGTSDPYVKLWLIEQGTKIEKRKTSIKPHNLQPNFNESFTFNVSPDKVEDDLQMAVTVMDYDILSSNDEMGHIILGRKGSETGQKHWKEMLQRPNNPVMMWHRLSPKCIHTSAFQRWKLVYCIVYERSIQGVARLEIFRSEDDFWKSRHGQHVTLDDLVYVREITPDLMTAKVHCAFAVKAGGRELHFGIPSSLELQQWVASISKAAFKKDARQGSMFAVNERVEDGDYEEPWDLQDIRVEVAENIASNQMGLAGHYDMKIGEKGISLRISGTTVQAWDFVDMCRTGASSHAFFFQVRTGDEFEFNSPNADKLLTRIRQYLPLSREIMTAEILARIHSNLNNFYPAVFKVLQTKQWAKTTSLTSIPSVGGTDISSDVFNSPTSPPHNGFPGVVTRYPEVDKRSSVSQDPSYQRRQSSFSRYKSPDVYNYEMEHRGERLGSTLSHEQVVGLSDDRPPPSPPIKRLTRIFRRGSKHEKQEPAHLEGSDYHHTQDLNSTTDSTEPKKQNWFVRGLLRTSGKKKKKDRNHQLEFYQGPGVEGYNEPGSEYLEHEESESLETEPIRPGLPRGPPPAVYPKPTPEFYRKQFYEAHSNQSTPMKASATTLTSINVDGADLSASDYAPIRKPQRQGGYAPPGEILDRFNEMKGSQAHVQRSVPTGSELKPVPAPRVSLRQAKVRQQNDQQDVKFRASNEQQRGPVMRHSSQETSKSGRRIHPLKELRPNSSTLSTDV